jgi:hypothetical protein
MMPNLCRGKFSEEIKNLLDANEAERTQRQPCAICSAHIFAEPGEIGGWVPVKHAKPEGRRLKGRRSKRTMGKLIIRGGAKTGSTHFKKKPSKRGTKKTYKR